MTTLRTSHPAGTKGRRWVTGLVVLGLALLVTGGLYSVVVPRPQTAHAAEGPDLIPEGHQLYQNA